MSRIGIAVVLAVLGLAALRCAHSPGIHDSPAFKVCRLACASQGLDVVSIYETAGDIWCDCRTEKLIEEGAPATGKEGT